MRPLLLLLLLCCALNARSQTFRASLIGGMNLSQVDGDDLLGFHQPGVNAGLRVVAVLNDRWRIGPELLYSEQGAQRNERASPVMGELETLRFQTLELPLSVFYKRWRLIGEAGASYQRLIDYRATNTQGEDVSATFVLRKNWVNLHLGASLLLTPRIAFNFRWSRHLADLQRTERPRLRGRNLSLRMVYTLGAGETLPAAPTSE